MLFICDTKLHLKVSMILIVLFISIISFFFLFLYNYFMNIYNTLFFSFNPHVKGFYNILLECNLITSKNEQMVFGYYIIMFEQYIDILPLLFLFLFSVIFIFYCLYFYFIFAYIFSLLNCT